MRGFYIVFRESVPGLSEPGYAPAFRSLESVSPSVT
jgi:hypothetical protein